MSKQERIQVSITRTVAFKKSVTFAIVVSTPVNADMGMVNNMLENAVEIASNWKGSGGDSS